VDEWVLSAKYISPGYSAIGRKGRITESAVGGAGSGMVGKKSRGCVVFRTLDGEKIEGGKREKARKKTDV